MLHSGLILDINLPRRRVRWRGRRAMRGRSYLLGSTLIAALGGLLFGFDTAVNTAMEG